MAKRQATLFAWAQSTPKRTKAADDLTDHDDDDSTETETPLSLPHSDTRSISTTDGPVCLSTNACGDHYGNKPGTPTQGTRQFRRLFVIESIIEIEKNTHSLANLFEKTLVGGLEVTIRIFEMATKF